MNIKEENDKLIEFWNNGYKEYKPQAFSKEMFNVENTLDEYTVFIGDNAKTVLNYGCGFDFLLFEALYLGKTIKKGLGIDTSDNVINYNKGVCELSNINNLEFVKGGIEVLNKIEDNSYEGILVSNVLDVIPEKTSDEIIKELKRILKSGGYFLLKVNFYLTKELIERTKAVEVEPNSYAINGVFRSYNLSTEDWIKKFDGFDCLKTDEYARIENGPKDRIMLFKKI